MSTAEESAGVVVVRRCTDDDADALHAREPHGRNYARGAAERQRRGEVDFLVAERDGVFVGSGEVTHDHPPEFKNLAVDEASRGHGLGSALIEAAERVVEARHRDDQTRPRALVLGVGLDSPRAAALYEKLGYVRMGVFTTTTYDYVDDRGVTRTATERDEDLIKSW